MAGHIPWATVDRTLRAARTIWVATGGSDGTPHVSPVWFLWDGAAAWFVVEPASVKARDLATRSEVVLHLGYGDEVTMLRGRAERITYPETIARVDCLYGDKYVDPGSGMRATIEMVGGLLFRVAPDRVITWMYGTVGHRTDFVPPFGGADV